MQLGANCKPAAIDCLEIGHGWVTRKFAYIHTRTLNSEELKRVINGRFGFPLEMRSCGVRSALKKRKIGRQRNTPSIC